MDSLTSAIRTCTLELKLDNQTEGFGNYFPNAIVQQCRRPEIKTWIQKNRPLALFTGHQMLRRKVTSFVLTPRGQAVNNLRIKYEQEMTQFQQTPFWTKSPGLIVKISIRN